MMEEIRKTELNDFSSVKKLEGQVLDMHYINRPDIYNKINSIDEKFFSNMLNDENARCFVYLIDGEVVGSLMSRLKPPINLKLFKDRKVLYIESIVVDEKYRGKGIATKLFEKIEDVAQKEKIDSIELEVFSFNKEAIKFYEKLGFSVKTSRYELNVNKLLGKS